MRNPKQTVAQCKHGQMQLDQSSSRRLNPEKRLRFVRKDLMGKYTGIAGEPFDAYRGSL